MPLAILCLSFLLYAGLLYTPAASAYTLKGSIETSEMQSIKSIKKWQKYFLKTVKVDRPLNEALIPKEQECLIWIRIPRSFAGTWESTRLERFTYVNGVAEPIRGHDVKYVRKYGMQADKAGNIWHVIGCPETQRSEFAQTEAISIVYPEEISPGEFYRQGSNYLLRLISTVGITISKPGKIVLDLNQSKNREMLEMQSNGQLINTDMAINEKGNPLHMNRCYLTKVSAFTPVEKEYGVDLHQDLARYLKMHDLEDLVP